MSDQITDVIALSLQQYFSKVKNVKIVLSLRKALRNLILRSHNLIFFSAAFLNQLIAAPKGCERQLEDTRHLKPYYLPK